MPSPIIASSDITSLLSRTFYNRYRSGGRIRRKKSIGSAKEETNINDDDINNLESPQLSQKIFTKVEQVKKVLDCVRDVHKTLLIGQWDPKLSASSFLTLAASALGQTRERLTDFWEKTMFPVMKKLQSGGTYHEELVFLCFFLKANKKFDKALSHSD